MMILRSSSASPFVRKIRIAAHVVGLGDTLVLETADTNNPDDPLRSQNPLGKLPTLVLENGETLYDSAVIIEYLDFVSQKNILLPQGDERFKILRLQALGDGIADAAIARVYEKRFRPEEKWHEPWLLYQREKIARALASLEGDLPGKPIEPNAGQIAIACALGYLDLRFNGAWRADHKKLVDWLQEFEQNVPAFGQTMPE